MNIEEPDRRFDSVSHEEAIRRAQHLIPLLRDQAPACERERRLTEPVMRALHETGLLRFLQPKAWGGMELPFVAYFDITEMLSRGDISTGWVVANLGSHHRNLVWWPEQAQKEVWGANPDAGIASGIAYQQGRARAVDGGLMVGGQWSFASGTDHSEWSMLACTVHAHDKPVDWIYALVPSREYEVIDDWHVLGMCATGSKSVRCKDVFVPAHRVLSMHVARPGHAWPGLEVHRNPHYRIPTSALGGHTIGGCMVGNARNALETCIALVKERSTSYTGARMRDFQTVQLRIARAAAQIDAAALLIRNDLLEAQALYEAGGALDVEAKLRYKRNCALGSRLCVEAIDSLHEMAGANGIYDHFPLARMFRDARAAAGHFSFSLDAQLPPWALVVLGGEFKSPTL
ncbi:MAG: acyl-CoA dehydrogenase family protein [Burkholderiales bacterium]